MGILKRRPKKSAYLALDIGSEFVKAVIFEIKEQAVNILGYGIHRQENNCLESGVIKDLSQVIENCELAITQASLQAGIRPFETVLGISGEQVRGFTTIVQFERNKPQQKISNKEINNIIEKVQEVSYSNSIKKFREDIGNDDLEIKLINGALTHIMIDGERVDSPVSFQGKKMQVGVFNAYAPLVQISNLQKIASSLEIEVIAIAAEPYALAEAIIPRDNLDFESIIVDVGGGTTDVILIQNQEVVGTRVFSLGGQDISREIAKVFEIPYEEAEELKYKYSKKELEDEDQIKKIEQAVRKALYFWEIGFEICLKEFKDLDYLPKDILLAGGGSIISELTESVLKVARKKEFKFSKEVEINLMTPQKINNLIDQTAKLESPQQVTPLSLATMLVDFVMGDNQVDLAIKKKG